MELSEDMNLATRMHVTLQRDGYLVECCCGAVLVRAGRFLLVPVLAATSLGSGGGGPQTLRERAAACSARFVVV